MTKGRWIIVGAVFSVLVFLGGVGIISNHNAMLEKQQEKIAIAKEKQKERELAKQKEKEDAKKQEEEEELRDEAEKELEEEKKELMKETLEKEKAKEILENDSSVIPSDKEDDKEEKENPFKDESDSEGIWMWENGQYVYRSRDSLREDELPKYTFTNENGEVYQLDDFDYGTATARIVDPSQIELYQDTKTDQK